MVRTNPDLPPPLSTLANLNPSITPRPIDPNQFKQALADFLERIKRYEQVYEPISDRRLHYIKLIDMWVVDWID